MKGTKRKLMLNGLGMPRALWMAALWSLPLTGWGQITNTWTGDGGDALASTVENWDSFATPAPGDSVLFSNAHAGNPQTNCTWDLDVALQDWTQTEDYSGTVTIETRYPGFGAFTNLLINGDAMLEGGAWRHQDNYNRDAGIGGGYPLIWPEFSHSFHRLAVTVGGDFVLGSNAVINLYEDRTNQGIGYESGPGKGNHGSRSAPGASHGGGGGTQLGALAPPTYGSVTRPVRLGSGCARGSPSGNAGSGALKLVVAGTAWIDGMVRADNVLGGGNRNAGTGGSILLQAAGFTGSGTITVDGGTGRYGSGGGRIALISTASNVVPSELTMTAHPGPNTRASAPPRAGTVYIETPVSRRVIIDQNNIGSYIAGAFTDLPALLEEERPLSLAAGELADATLVATNHAVLRVPYDLLIDDFAWLEGSLTLGGESRIGGKSAVLYIKAEEPANFPQDFGGGTILSNAGHVVWGNGTHPLAMRVVATNGPNGSVAMAPDHAHGLVPYGGDITLTATPDAGYKFVYWELDAPVNWTEQDVYWWDTIQRELAETAFPINNPLTIENIEEPFEIRAVFASDNPDARTWTGAGTDNLASTADNWIPASAPTHGAEIVFDNPDELVLNEVLWDLDIEVASWYQTHGHIVIQTVYPTVGPFTNLTITGDVTIEGGSWSHPENAGGVGGHEPTDWLSVSVGGNFTLGTNAVIDLDGRGFASARGPAPSNTSGRGSGSWGASHGGQGSAAAIRERLTYGSVIAPTTLGSGGGTTAHRGGGALRLTVDGTLTVQGEMLAEGTYSSSSAQGAAGGSIYLRCATIAGDGLVSVRGGRGYFGGGGGRIAVWLGESEDFADITFDARGNAHPSAAGTIYLGGIRNGRLIGDLIVDNDRLSNDNTFTLLPPDMPEDPIDTFKWLPLHIRDNARLGLTVADLRVRDLHLDPEAILHLNGFDLYVLSRTDPIPRLEGTVIDDGGQIIWVAPGTLFLIR